MTPAVIRDPQTLQIATYLNGKCMQKSSTADMVFSVAELISQLSQDTTLPAGTLILTGTPEVRLLTDAVFFYCASSKLMADLVY